MNFTKINWGLRSVWYRILLRNIGFPSYIGKPVYVSSWKNIIIGSRFRIYPGLRAEIVNKNSFLKIGENVSIGQNFHVVSYNDELKIGDNVTIAGNVFVTNCDHNYKGIYKSILENELIYKKTVIGDNCFIGNNAVILAGTSLGEGCVVGANAVLKGKYPPYSVIIGVPGKVVKKYTKKG